MINEETTNDLIIIIMQHVMIDQLNTFKSELLRVFDMEVPVMALISWSKQNIFTSQNWKHLEIISMIDKLNTFKSELLCVFDMEVPVITLISWSKQNTLLHQSWYH